MVQYNEERPLSPPKAPPRSDEESAVFPPSIPTKLAVKWRRTNECFVCILFVVFILIAGVLAFALTVLRFVVPQFKLRETAVSNLKFNNNSTLTRLSGTLFGEVSLRNTIFENETVNVLHGNDDFGARKVIAQERIRAREMEMALTSIKFVVNGEGEGKNNTLREEISLGVMRIRSYEEVQGEVSVLSLMKKAKVAVMVCTIDLDFSSTRIKDLFCK